jgi:hypothetical protein
MSKAPEDLDELFASIDNACVGPVKRGRDKDPDVVFASTVSMTFWIRML